MIRKRLISLCLCVALLCMPATAIAAPASALSFGGNTVSEYADGLGFRFDIAVEGMEHDHYIAIYDHATVNGEKLISMGAQVYNGNDSKVVPAVYVVDMDDHSAAFIVRVINIPQAHHGSPITAIPYYITEKNGVPTTVFGQPQTATYRDVRCPLPALQSWFANNIAAATAEYDSKLGSNPLTFSMMSDMHLRRNAPHIVENIEASSAWANHMGNDFIMMSGDFIIGDLSKEDSLGLIDTAVRAAGTYGDLPVYSVKGNHDTNEDYKIGVDPDTGKGIYSNVDRITDEEFYDHAIAQSENSIVTDPANPYGGYYYVNFPEQKIRMVCLNTTEINQSVDILDSTKAAFRRNGALSEAQTNWVANTALLVPEDWAVMMVAHIPPLTGATIGIQGETTADPPFHTRGIRNAALTTLLEAFVKGESGTVTADKKTVSYDFSAQGPREFIGHFSGHVHEDSHSVFNDIHYVVVNCTTPQKRWDTSLDRTANSETSLSLNTFIINRETRTVECVKIGTGESFSFTW